VSIAPVAVFTRPTKFPAKEGKKRRRKVQTPERRIHLDAPLKAVE